MKLLLDESVPRRFGALLRSENIDASNFPNGWKGLADAQLLARVQEQGFQCLLTSDRNLQHQQTVAKWRLGVIVLPAQRFQDLIPYLPRILDAVAAAIPGAVINMPK